MKLFIPIILVLFMLQSCGGSNVPEEDNGLEDVNPVVEEGAPDAEYDGDGRDDEREPDNERSPDPDDEIEGGLDYDIEEENDPGYELE